MRRIRYAVAMSLDGYIAGPHGEADWIVNEPLIDFTAMMSEFDTLLVGRKTFEPMLKAGRTTVPGMRTVVVSTTLRQADHPDGTILSTNVATAVAALRAGTGKDIWLFGGGHLFRNLLARHLVDRVAVAVMPALLGGGTPLLPRATARVRLALDAHRVSPSGIVSLTYRINTA